MSLNLTLNKNLQQNPGGYGSSLYNKPTNILQSKAHIANSGLGNYSEHLTAPNTQVLMSSIGGQSVLNHE